MGGASSLLEKAVEVLAHGSVHTLDMARQVLNLQGHPEAVSRTVFALLGSDARFELDAAGVWSLRDDVDPSGTPLLRLSFAVVDVETTGGTPTKGGRITEVAVVHVDGGVVGETFETLVDPGCAIPPRIQGITGISTAMVQAAPPFEAVAEGVLERLRHRIFVAHNVSFDWRFVHAELLASLGDAPELERICTVRMGRRLAPHLKSHGLDALAQHFAVPIRRRHRALGDALATARVLVHLLTEAERQGIPDIVSLHHHLES